MFFTHFNMNTHPFAENPPIDWLLTDSRFEQALARMKFFLEQGRLALITGQTGVGKSSLLRMVRQAIPQMISDSYNTRRTTIKIPEI
jgi:general secretion pathway protein A